MSPFPSVPYAIFTCARPSCTKIHRFAVLPGVFTVRRRSGRRRSVTAKWTRQAARKESRAIGKFYRYIRFFLLIFLRGNTIFSRCFSVPRGRWRGVKRQRAILRAVYHAVPTPVKKEKKILTFYILWTRDAGRARLSNSMVPRTIRNHYPVLYFTSSD